MITDKSQPLIIQTIVTGNQQCHVEVIEEKGFSLDRKKISSSWAVFICVCFVVLDVSKQLSSYAIRYYNNDQYPIPQTAIVTIIELIKCIIMVILVFIKGVWKSIQFSLIFSVPSVMYAVNNNIYFYALYFTTPPVWMVLIQSRIIMTAVVYRFLFNRSITPVQWIALVLLLVSIGITQITDYKLNIQRTNILTIVLSLISAALSAGAAIFTEILFKNNKRPFSEMQLQLYLYSFVISVGFSAMEYYHKPVAINKDISWFLIYILILSLLLGSAGGIAVAAIMKNLDNIVKSYTSSFANMLTAICSSFLFPDRFSLNFIFILALGLMFLSIWLYENKTFNFTEIEKHAHNFLLIKGVRPILFTIVCLSLIVLISSSSFQLSIKPKRPSVFIGFSI